nr:hypothetical protein [Yersinia sp. Marseille-Q5920]
MSDLHSLIGYLLTVFILFLHLSPLFYQELFLQLPKLLLSKLGYQNLIIKKLGYQNLIIKKLGYQKIRPVEVYRECQHHLWCAAGSAATGLSGLCLI